MVRTLPKKHNPLIHPDHAPACKSLFLSVLVAHLRIYARARVSRAVHRHIYIITPTLRVTVADAALFGRVADDELLARRRLGKTHLAVKREQVGTSNATKLENLGPFEYAHLRAPLPKDLKGSEIFPSHAPSQHPDTYFLMVSIQSWFYPTTALPCYVGNCASLTSLTATKQGRLCQRHWHVQDRVSVGQTRRREIRARVSQVPQRDE